MTAVRTRILYATLSAVTLAVMVGRLASTDRPVLGEAMGMAAVGLCMAGVGLVVVLALIALVAVPVLGFLAILDGLFAPKRPAPVPAASGNAREES